MKSKSQIVFEVRGDLGDHEQLICTTDKDVVVTVESWMWHRPRRKGDTLTIKIDKMTRKEINQLEEF